MNILFKTLFHKKKIPVESWPKINLGPDADVSIVGAGSDQKSSRSATLLTGILRKE
jgi:hypothetical protein